MLIALLLTLNLFSDSSAGVANPEVLWSKKSLVTCWATTPEALKKTPVFLKVDSLGKKELFTDLKILHLPQDLQGLIQKAVTESFSATKTGINFTGWKDCHETPDFDVAIFYAREPKSTVGQASTARYLAATDIGDLSKNSDYPDAHSTAVRINESYILGYQGENFSDRFKNLIRWRYGAENATSEVWNTYLQYLFAMDVVHEFAHVAGLMHEAQIAVPSELKRFDVSYHQNISETMTGSTSSLGVRFGSYQPFSSMSAFLPSYENAAEKTKLICELLKAEKPETKAEVYFTNLWTALKDTKSKADYSPKALEALLCQDTSYLQFHPSELASKKAWLNPEDQELLKKLYSGTKPSKIKISRESGFSKKEKYLQKLWKKLTDVQW